MVDLLFMMLHRRRLLSSRMLSTTVSQLTIKLSVSRRQNSMVKIGSWWGPWQEVWGSGVAGGAPAAKAWLVYLGRVWWHPLWLFLCRLKCSSEAKKERSAQLRFFKTCHPLKCCQIFDRSLSSWCRANVSWETTCSTSFCCHTGWSKIGS